jgi:hypothetical protein
MPSAPPFVSGWNVFTRISFAAPPLSLRRVFAYLPIRTDPLPTPQLRQRAWRLPPETNTSSVPFPPTQ